MTGPDEDDWEEKSQGHLSFGEKVTINPLREFLWAMKIRENRT
jgi:hypothetical protein